MNMSAPALLWLVPFSDALASSSNFLSIDTYASRRLSGDQLIAPDQSCLTPDAMTSEVPDSSESSFSLFEASVTTALYSLSKKRSEEHTSELQSLMRISYAVFCLKKKKNIK